MDHGGILIALTSVDNLPSLDCPNFLRGGRVGENSLFSFGGWIIKKFFGDSRLMGDGIWVGPLFYFF